MLCDRAKGQPMTEKLKKCFVIAPIGADGSETRTVSDTVLEGFIVPALDAVGGFAKPQRADHINAPGDIPKQIVERIANDDLVIADLTDRNANVFYELAIRHTLGKPFVQLIHKSQEIPFDVGQQRTIKYDHTDLLGSKKVIERIRSAVTECMAPGFKPETPLGYSATLEILNKGDAESQSLKLILEKLDQVLAKLPAPLSPELQALQQMRAVMPQPQPSFGLDAQAAFNLGRWAAGAPRGDLMKLETIVATLNAALGPEKAAEFLKHAATALNKKDGAPGGGSTRKSSLAFAAKVKLPTKR